MHVRKCRESLELIIVHTICAPVIQFAASVTPPDVHLGEIANTSHLNIVWSLHEMNAFESAVWNCSRPAARFGTPCDFFCLCVADGSGLG